MKNKKQRNRLQWIIDWMESWMDRTELEKAGLREPRWSVGLSRKGK